MLRRDPRRTQGLTLIEAALVVCLLGIVLAVGIPAFARALRTSKMAEAPEQLQRIYAAAAAYYAAPAPAASPAQGAAADALAQAVQAGPMTPGRCLPAAAGPTPSQPSREPVPVNFGAPDTPGAPIWRALGYDPHEALRYRYSILPARSGCGLSGRDDGGDLLTLRAEGDLDGDGVLSLFERTATVENGELVLDPLLIVHDRVE